MGTDVCIYFKLKEGEELPSHLTVLSDSQDHWSIDTHADDYGPDGATHEINTLWRYFSPYYLRGHWPQIEELLKILFDCPTIETVWYFGDSQSCDPPADGFSIDDMNKYRRAWCINKGHVDDLQPAMFALLHCETKATPKTVDITSDPIRIPTFTCRKYLAKSKARRKNDNP